MIRFMPRESDDDVPGDDHVELLLFRLLAMLLPHVHAHDGAHAGRRQFGDGVHRSGGAARSCRP